MILGRNNGQFNSSMPSYMGNNTYRAPSYNLFPNQQATSVQGQQQQGMNLPIGSIMNMVMGSGGSTAGAGTAATAGTAASTAGATSTGAAITGAGATGAGGTAAATGGSAAAAGGASMLPALGWAAPFVAGAAALSADAMQRGADENDLLRWWGGPVTNIVEGDFEKAAKGGLRVAGGPFGGLWDLIEGENTEMAIGSSLLGPMGAGLTGLIMGKKSEDIIPWFSGFVE